MTLRYQDTCENIDWQRVHSLLKEVGMAAVEPDKHRTSFENSYSTIFVFDKEKMIGIGRMISDGVRQSALYDIAIDPSYQGLGLGKKVVEKLMEATPNCTFLLYASPGKEDFYRKLAFKRMKTGMILFADPSRMEDLNFVEK